jgi:hypothetical protein
VGICSLLLTRTWKLDDLQHFRKLGFIEYNGRIQVHKSLLNVILHNRVLEQNALGASLSGPSRGQITNRLRAMVSKIDQNGD